MDAAEVVARLVAVEPLDLAAVELAVRLENVPPEPQELGAMQHEIEEAIGAMMRHAEATRRLLWKCQTLPAVPGAIVPGGF